MRVDMYIAVSEDDSVEEFLWLLQMFGLNLDIMCGSGNTLVREYDATR